MDNPETQNQEQEAVPNILDTIIGSQTQSSLSTFEPAALVSKILSLLKDRDRQILTNRFGLEGNELKTLEAIGKEYNLTRERVRQIEKDSLGQLRKKKIPELENALQLILDTISEHGNIVSEEFLIQTLIPSKFENPEKQAVKFLLNLGTQFTYFKESPAYLEGWSILGFNQSKLDETTSQLVDLLKQEHKVLSQEAFYEKFKASDYYKQLSFELSEKVLKSYLALSKHIQINPFDEVGLKDWSEVKPRDVGDKAYLVLKHHGQPEHYSAITKMINDHKFDSRVAYQETVHNELIKDDRFVLIGRGIYALSEWGYKKGVVADVIKEILQAAGKALTREEIIAEVLKRRQVKRNTILVGLSNKGLFQKIGKDRYILATNSS